MPSVLIIDDNEEILSANKEYLSEQGFKVTCANTGIKALAYLNQNRYDCIVLDVLLPDLDGFAICKAARTITNTPIIFLSCLEEADDKIRGLTAGGDDYMTKPYSLKELLTRINVNIRKTLQAAIPEDDFFIDRENKTVRVLSKSLFLSQREFDLLTLFYDNPNRVFSKEEILEKVWLGDAEVGAVATRILRLRRRLEFAEDMIGRIVSKYGSGYCLIPPGADEQL